MMGIQLQTVVAACPYALLELGVKRSCLLTVLNAVGAQLEKAILSNSIHYWETEEMGRAWNSCSNLKEVSLLLILKSAKFALSSHINHSFLAWAII